jgi:hypothetical protein
VDLPTWAAFGPHFLTTKWIYLLNLCWFIFCRSMTERSDGGSVLLFRVRVIVVINEVRCRRRFLAIQFTEGLRQAACARGREGERERESVCGGSFRSRSFWSLFRLQLSQNNTRLKLCKQLHWNVFVFSYVFLFFFLLFFALFNPLPDVIACAFLALIFFLLFVFQEFWGFVFLCCLHFS